MILENFKWSKLSYFQPKLSKNFFPENIARELSYLGLYVKIGWKIAAESDFGIFQYMKKACTEGGWVRY